MRLEEGLADEVVFRVFQFVMCKTALQNSLTNKVAAKCRACNVPMVFSYYVRSLGDPWYIEESERIVDDERFGGLSLLELADDHSWRGKTRPMFFEAHQTVCANHPCVIANA